MTEAEWLCCADPVTMLDFLRGRTSERKLRLFAVAVCRYGPLTGLDAIESGMLDVVERGADTPASLDEFTRASSALLAHYQTRPARKGWSALRSAVLAVADAAGLSIVNPTDTGFFFPAAQDVVQSIESYWLLSPEARNRGRIGVRGTGCDLLREITGNPFRRVSVEPARLPPDVTALTGHIYYDRALDLLPELADTLQGAGCTDAELLAHLRCPRPHVQGCWAVDLILGKE